MTTHRVTQQMMMRGSLDAVQIGLGRLARTQEQLSTGRVLNRPSDSPTDTSAAMRLRASLSDQEQYARNAEDGLGWLGQLDATLSSVNQQLGRARELALQGANTGAGSAASREALAIEVDQIRAGLLATANTTYLGRPVFGGTTAGTSAYDATGTFVGSTGTVNRTVADGVRVRVDVDGPSVLGPAGATVFDQLAALSADLRAGNTAGLRTDLGAIDASMKQVTGVLADVGTRTNRLEQSAQLAKDAVLSLTSSLSSLENTDLPRATIDLKMQEVAYQAALGATARVTQPSLLDFLR